ncbi:MAG: phosphatase [Parcubacteria group bacterium Gr01-1014_3]|nr:MAG: phosphatase [Parcubacteria group bacterium Gr01-1014_3]
MPQRRAVFLDRDGTLIKAIARPGFDKMTAPFSMNELEFDPDVDLAMKIISDLGYLRIITTNQPDVAYGHVSEEEWTKIHEAVLARVQPDDCFMCRHTREAGCPMKKPNPGMLIAAADKWNIDLSHSYIIGDTYADVSAGYKAGCNTIILERPYNHDSTVIATCRVTRLLAAANHLKMLDEYGV